MPTRDYGSVNFSDAQDRHQEILGDIKPKGPAVSSWEEPHYKVEISLDSGPPPWELEGDKDPSDARNFVEVPSDWVLYWINPKVLERDGWRGWKPVMASDPRVKVKVPAMRSPENQIRRGHMGDILAYMPRHWYESLKKKTASKTAAQTQASLDKLEQVKDEFARGKYPNISLESARHPTDTIGRPVVEPI